MGSRTWAAHILNLFIGVFSATATFIEEDDVNNYSIHDVVMPLPGFDVSIISIELESVLSYSFKNIEKDKQYYFI